MEGGCVPEEHTAAQPLGEEEVGDLHLVLNHVLNLVLNYVLHVHTLKSAAFLKVALREEVAEIPVLMREVQVHVCQSQVGTVIGTSYVHVHE